uniref:Fucolectin tachylectin-4 pentraxin-1 domain-containing protein n=1 Tax=Sinocyclocheilus grahami TaxID=75366 RepID=A0A672KRV4_SINGR
IVNLLISILCTQIGCNLATGRTITQSSTYGLWLAQQAIDFNPGFIQPSSSCSSTTAQTNPWWRVDLRYIYRVRRVVITNRLDCCPEQIDGAEIHPLSVGRYVNLFIPGDSKYLTLCEVEVYEEGVIKQADLVFWETINAFTIVEIWLSKLSCMLSALSLILSDRCICNKLLQIL